jgi:hypothetical protein
MPGTIAVYVNDQGETVSPLYYNGKIVIYGKERERWKVLKEQRVEPEKNTGIKGLRLKMAEVINFLGDCKIFVGLSVVGIPYFELEKHKCSVWEFAGKPEGFLDYILEKEEKTEQEKQEIIGKKFLPRLRWQQGTIDCP